MGQAAAPVTGRSAEGGRSSLGWQSPVLGHSLSLVVGTPLGQKSGRPADWSGPHCHTWDTCPHLHTYSCSASMLPDSGSGSGPGSTGQAGRRKARTRPGLQLPCLICPCLSSLALPAPRSFHPGLATHLLTHSDPYSRPAGQATTHLWHLLESILFPCRRECLVGEGPIPTERRSLLACSASFLPFLLAPKCPGGPSECRVALGSRWGGSHPLCRSFPGPPTAMLPSWIQQLVLSHSVVGTLTGPPHPQSLDL